MPTLRTLCSGGELFGVGAAAAGYTHVDGYEIVPRFAAIARQNGFAVRVADVCSIDFATLVPVDHLHASPSCKTASNAARQQGETEADEAVAQAIARAVLAHQGRSFTLENVWFYRNYESFQIILAALVQAGFVYVFDHINMADFGVPQTRKRLILRAVRRSWRERVPSLRPTHSQRGGILTERWRGWYGAIEHLLDTLPETQPAPWQQARMPQALRMSMLMHSGRSTNRDGVIYPTQALRPPGEPAYTISTMSGSWYKAYIVSGGNTQLARIETQARHDHEPMFTIAASDGAVKAARAFIVAGQNARTGGNAACLTMRDEAEPLWTVTSGGSPGEYKASLAGRWVAMTPEALGCFQTVPQTYIGLTPEINGNGVPPWFARQLLGSLLRG